MKLLIFSDSHGYTHNMVKAINSNRDAEIVIHLGDCTRDVLNIMASFSEIRYEFVCGNNDWSSRYPVEKLLEIEGLKIFITHGHLYGVKNSYDRLIQRAISVGADIVFFGHTHKSDDVFSDGIRLINPGSISLPIPPAKPSYCVAEIANKKSNIKFLAVKP